MGSKDRAGSLLLDSDGLRMEEIHDALQSSPKTRDVESRATNLMVLRCCFGVVVGIKVIELIPTCARTVVGQ